MKSSKLLLTAIFSCSVTSLFAGGFQINEQGARQTGMVGTFVATANDPSAVFYNPAGLVNLEGKQISLGSTMVSISNTFAGTDPSPGFGTKAKAKTGYFFPSTFYYTQKINDKNAFGIGFFTPFGLGENWNEENYVGRFVLREIDLKTFYLNPTYAFRANEYLSIGVGLDFIWSHVFLSKQTAVGINPNNGEIVDAGLTEISGTSDMAIGWNVGLLSKIDKVRLGLSYKHEVTSEFKDGEAKFNITLPTTDPFYAVAKSKLVNQGATTELTYPSTLTIGAAYQITENVSVEADWSFVQWSAFEKIDLKFDSLPTETIPENYKDVWNLRFGAEWKTSEKFTVRYGYLYDRNPVPDESVSPLLPDSDRHNFSVGLGWKINENFNLDVAEMMVFANERNTNGKNRDNLNGEYRTFLNLVGLSLTYKF
ncbi:transporter [bacterium]|nr:transporter [bacterium]